jgi:hypothetical protein
MRTLDGARTLILVTSHPGQPTCSDLARQAMAGERPRKDYVELARLIGADVLDCLGSWSIRVARNGPRDLSARTSWTRPI